MKNAWHVATTGAVTIVKAVPDTVTALMRISDAETH